MFDLNKSDEELQQEIRDTEADGRKDAKKVKRIMWIVVGLFMVGLLGFFALI